MSDPVLQLDQPVATRGLPALKEYERRLRKVIPTLVGRLYPGIASEELAEVRAEIYRRETGHREIPGAGISIREA